MGILDRILGHKSSVKEPGGRRTETVELIARELAAESPERARYLASYAYLLGRVAYADQEVSDEELAKIVEILERVGKLPAETARLVSRLVKSRNELFGRTEDYLVTREFREVSSREQRLRLLHSLFAVAAADDVITPEEESVIRQISSELGLELSEFVSARSEFSDKRSIFKTQ